MYSDMKQPTQVITIGRAYRHASGVDRTNNLGQGSLSDGWRRILKHTIEIETGTRPKSEKSQVDRAVDGLLTGLEEERD